jgi:hypothetical protein
MARNGPGDIERRIYDPVLSADVAKQFKDAGRKARGAHSSA